MLKPETITLPRAQFSFAKEPFNAPSARYGIADQYGGRGAISKQAGADKNTGIVIQVQRRAANLHANGKHSATLARIKQGRCGAQAGKGGSAPLPDQI
jgi:hypothetical protein